MATTTEKLILELQVKVEKYNANILKAAKKTEQFQNKTEKAFSAVERRAKRAGDSLFKFSNVAKGVFAAIGARELVRFADDITLADNQLRNVTASTEQFNFVMMELNSIANETRQDVNGLVSIFSRFTRAGQEAGFSVQELLGFTEDLTKAFKLEGNTTAEVNSTLLQLTQSFRKGAIDGEEFRALSENSTIALQALAKQMRVNIGELKELGAQGKLTPRDLVEGLRDARDQINSEFKNLAPTIAEVGTALGNVFSTAFRASGATKVVSDFASDIIGGLTAVSDTISGKNDEIIAQYELIKVIGVDAVNRIRKKSEEIAELKVQFKVEADPQKIEILKERFKKLKDEIKGERGDVGFFESITETTKSLITDFSLLITKAEAAKLLAPPKKKDDATLDTGDDKLSAKEVERVKKLDAVFIALEDERNATRDHLQQLSDIEGEFLTQREADEINRFAAEKGRIQAKRDEGLELAAGDLIAQQDLRDEANLTEEVAEAAHQQKLTDIKENQDKQKTKLDIKLKKDEQARTRQNVSSIITITSALVGSNSAIGKALFVAGQALAATQVFFNGQVAAFRALAELGPIAGPPVAASINASSALSIAAIAATTLGSLAGGGGGGGGSISGGGGGGAAPPPEDDTPETTTDVSVTAFDGDVVTGGRLELIDTEGASSGDQLMGEWYNQSIRSGRIREKGRI